MVFQKELGCLKMTQEILTNNRFLLEFLSLINTPIIPSRGYSPFEGGEGDVIWIIIKKFELLYFINLFETTLADYSIKISPLGSVYPLPTVTWLLPSRSDI